MLITGRERTVSAAGTAKGVRLTLAATVIALLSVAASGFWLGEYAWFGGYASVRSAFGWSAFGIGLGVTALRWRAQPRRWPMHLGFFLCSQILFGVAIAAGQVAYADPRNATEALDLFSIALRGGL